LIPRTADVVAADPDLDFLVVVQDPPRDPGPVPSRNEERVQLLASTLAGSPRFACAVQTTASELTAYARGLLGAHSVHLANGLTHAVGALDRAIRYGELRRRFLGRANRAALSNALAGATVDAGDRRRTLNEAESIALLERHGIATARQGIATDVDAAARIASEIGYPVVVKVLSAQVPHKTEVGGVFVGLPSDAAVRAACETIADAVQRNQPSAVVDGFLIAEQVIGGTEMIAGISIDPLVGPVVIVGIGGILVEALGDIAMRLPPFDRDEARRMIDELRGRPILDGIRGRPAADVDALADALVRLGDLALAERGRLLELDVNPLFVLPWGQGTKAADALAVIRVQGTGC
jgi:acyl-CoA synthetase (NDP forming)